MSHQNLNIMWFGPNPIYDKYFDSYKKYLPQFDIKVWNEKNFKSKCRYYNMSLVKGNWAFASDYARFKILYENGVLYLDTDVELIKEIPKSFFENSFLATEKHTKRVTSGLIMYFKEKRHPLLKYIIDYFEKYYWNSYLQDGKALIKALQWYSDNTYELRDINQKIKDIQIYNSEYFCPLNKLTEEQIITDNTYSIHWYTTNWTLD